LVVENHILVAVRVEVMRKHPVGFGTAVLGVKHMVPEEEFLGEEFHTDSE
jgi:hypothetical protein